MSEENSEEKPAAARRVKVATLLTVFGLLVTLVFNTLGVWRGAKQDEAGRIAQQISLLTGLNQNLTSSEAEISQAGFEPCGLLVEDDDPDPAGTVNDAQPKLFVALDYYEYLAWLFNEEQLTVEGARDHFDDRMIAGWNIAGKNYETLRDGTYRQLARFVKETKNPPPDRCDE